MSITKQQARLSTYQASVAKIALYLGEDAGEEITDSSQMHSLWALARLMAVGLTHALTELNQQLVHRDEAVQDHLFSPVVNEAEVHLMMARIMKEALGVIPEPAQATIVTEGSASSSDWQEPKATKTTGHDPINDLQKDANRALVLEAIESHPGATDESLPVILSELGFGLSAGELELSLQELEQGGEISSKPLPKDAGQSETAWGWFTGATAPGGNEEGGDVTGPVEVEEEAEIDFETPTEPDAEEAQ